jgi:hypothetical protein
LGERNHAPAMKAATTMSPMKGAQPLAILRGEYARGAWRLCSLLFLLIGRWEVRRKCVGWGWMVELEWVLELCRCGDDAWSWAGNVWLVNARMDWEW